MTVEKPIHDVCRQLGTTSRTIRYYEQTGLIETIQKSKNTPRKLNADNIEKLQRILFLRKLGLSLKEIKSVLHSEADAAELIRNRHTAIYKEITSLRNRICLLEEVLTVAENHGDIYSLNPQMPFSEKHFSNEKQAENCIQLLLNGKYSELAASFTKKLKEVLSAEHLETVWQKTVTPCGAFQNLSKKIIKGNNVIYYLQFAQLGVTVRFVFHDGLIGGLWFDYYDMEETV